EWRLTPALQSLVQAGWRAPDPLTSARKPVSRTAEPTGVLGCQAGQPDRREWPGVNRLRPGSPLGSWDAVPGVRLGREAPRRSRSGPAPARGPVRARSGPRGLAATPSRAT